jgi:N-carbamoyl-L-amino-acid hydrolase
MSLAVDGTRVAGELATLASISELPAPAVTRVVFGDADLRARAYVERLCRDAGLAIRTDAIGNTFARWAGRDPALPPVATGSHIDAIPNAGAYDGTVGVLGGLEAIRALQRAGLTPLRSIELIVFTSEEPTRFGVGCLGSRMMAGTLGAAAVERLRDRDGTTADAARRTAGFTGELSSVRLPVGCYSAFVELHIEQGPRLEREALDIGAVTAIAAPASLRLAIEGEGGHAGAVLMPDRHDAFLAGAEIALALEAAARSSGAVDTVATVGVCEVFPGAINSVPARTRLEIDVRDIDPRRRDAVLERLSAACREVAGRRGVAIETTTINADAPAACDPRIVDIVTEVSVRRGLRVARMISRAYHDSLFMAAISPTAMIFVPCRGGVSHRPDEYASPDAIANGVGVLADTLAALAH